jgi:hypothetical protein
MVKRITHVGDMDVSFVLFDQSSQCVGPSVKTDEIRLGPVKCQISPVQKSDLPDILIKLKTEIKLNAVLETPWAVE